MNAHLDPQLKRVLQQVKSLLDNLGNDLQSVDTKTPDLGATLAANSTPVVFASDQFVPAGAVPTFNPFPVAGLDDAGKKQYLPIRTLSSGGFANAVVMPKDVGRNSTNYFMKAQTLSSATDTLQSLAGYKSGAEVAGTTTPAVVTKGKTYRINHIVVTYVTVSTVGSVIVSLRANTGGLVSITSPVVNSWQVGGSTSSVGTTQTIVIPFPDGLEFEAGTGIGLSVKGFASAGAVAAVGYVKASISGFEY